MTKKILCGLIFLVGGFFVYDFFLKPPSFKNGAEAPVFSGTLVNGSAFSLSDLRGQYVLVYFWGSWCGPCIKEIPSLKALHQKYHGKSFSDGSNFQVVSIALEKSDKYTKQIISNRGLSWPHHIIDTNPIIMVSKYAQLYEVKNLPTKFLVNPDGNIIANNLSYDELDKLLEARLK